jgi:hypothetical protein
LQVIEEEEVEVPVTKSVTKESKEVPTSEVHQDGEGKDVKMDDVEANGPGTENDLPSAEEKPGLDSSKVDHSLLFFSLFNHKCVNYGMSIIWVFMEFELSESIFGEECFIGWIIAQEGNYLVGL